MNADPHTREYNNFATDYTAKFLEADAKSRGKFTKYLPELKGKRVLDVGCGNGHDVASYTAAGAIATGIDPANAFIAQARKDWPSIDVKVGVAEELPFANASFNLVTSVYALQNTDVPKSLEEIARVLRPGGQLLALTKHPMRQFLEKKEENRDYWKQEIVSSTIFGGSIPLNEPSHTLTEYLNPTFLQQFDLKVFEEDHDFPASDRMGQQNYPCYFIMGATKR